MLKRPQRAAAAVGSSRRSTPAAKSAPAPSPDAPRPDPDARRLFLEGIAQPPASLGAPTNPSRVTTLALEHTARGEAGGMRPEGEVMAAELTEGRRASTLVTVGVGECATFIAQGGLGVIEVDLYLTSGTGSALRVLAEDPITGPIAVIGGRGACFAHSGSGPLAAELHARVRRGAGVVLVRSFRRGAKP